MNPLVSVIVPVYNGERHLQECLDCLAGQTYPALEIICVDDGSTDTTPQMLSAFEKQHDNAVVVRQENQGAGCARNHGLELAHGDYLFFFDSDDYCDTHLIERSVAEADRTQADFVWMPFYIHDEVIERPLLLDADFPLKHYPRSPFSWKDNPDWLFQCVHNYPWNKLFRKSFVDEHQLKFPPLRLTEDMGFSAPAAVFAKRIAWIEDAFVYHRQGLQTSLMSQKDSSPSCFYQAFASLKAFLSDNGVYDRLKVSYWNWALGGCKYNLETLRDYDNFQNVYRLLTSQEAFEALGFADIDEASIHHQALREFFSHIKDETPPQYLLRRFGFEQRSSELAHYRSLIHAEDTARAIASIREAHDLACAGRDEAHRHLDMLRREIDSLHGELDSLREEFDAQMNAAEQRVGRALCALPRAIQKRLIARRERREAEGG